MSANPRHPAGAVVFALLLALTAWGAPVAPDHAKIAGEAYVGLHGPPRASAQARGGDAAAPAPYTIDRVHTVKAPDGGALCHVFDLDPRGYVVLSADDELSPIIAYSFSNNFRRDDTPQNVLLHLLTWDLSARFRELPTLDPELKQRNRSLWDHYLTAPSAVEDGAARSANTAARASDVEQWGPWLETQWNQRAPYNRFCPMDTNTDERCIVGCTATAMGQILNYWEYPCTVSFASPGDDYSYTWDPGENGVRSMSIDDDCDTPFGTWTLHYSGSDNDVGYISYAAGLSHEMKYSSDGSAVVPDPTAFMGKFRYASAERLIYDDCVAPNNFYTKLIRNMKNAQPVILSVFQSCVATNDPQYAPGGHSIVADGYKSSGEYHLNYGWGGNSDGWYAVPTSMPRYGVVRREVVNINPYVWPMFHQNPSHTSRGPHEAAAKDNLRWRYATGDEIGSSPAVAQDGTVYIASRDKKLYAIRANGTLKWSFTAGGDLVVSSPAIGPCGAVYVGSSDGKLYAISPATGGPLWVYPTGDEIESSPTVGRDGTIYFGTTDSSLYALYPTGTLKWMTSLSGCILWSSPALGSDGTVYVGAGLTLTARDADGSSQWSYTLGSNEVYSSPAVGNDGTVYIGTLDNELFAINPNGTKKWSYATGGAIYSSPAIGIDGTVYVGSNDNKVHAVTPGGTQKWAFVTGGDVKSSPAIGWDGEEERIYVGSNDKKLYALNTNGVKQWQVRLPDSIVSSPAIAENGTLYVGCTDHRVYAIAGNNHSPVLAWTGEANYVGDGVHPDSTSSSSQTFTFRVKYTDKDNHFPKSGYPKLRVKTGGVEIADSPFAMSATDSADIDCVNGKLYSCTVSGLSDSDSYKYAFDAYDTKNASAGGSPASARFGPLVDSTPPDTQITSGPSGFIDAGYNNVAFWWSGSDAITPSGNLVYSHRFSNTGWWSWSGTKNTTVMYGEGAYTFDVRARDELGNIDATPASQSFTVDGSPPSNPDSCTEAGGATSGSWQNSVSAPSFSWSGASDHGSALETGKHLYRTEL